MINRKSAIFANNMRLRQCSRYRLVMKKYLNKINASIVTLDFAFLQMSCNRSILIATIYAIPSDELKCFGSDYLFSVHSFDFTNEYERAKNKYLNSDIGFCIPSYVLYLKLSQGHHLYHPFWRFEMFWFRLSVFRSIFRLYEWIWTH